MKGKEPKLEPRSGNAGLRTANREPAEPNRHVGSQLAWLKAWNLLTFCEGNLCHLQAGDVCGSG